MTRLRHRLGFALSVLRQRLPNVHNVLELTLLVAPNEAFGSPRIDQFTLPRHPGAPRSAVRQRRAVPVRSVSPFYLELPGQGPALTRMEGDAPIDAALTSFCSPAREPLPAAQP